MVTSKTPGAGEDILASSANNLYVGVTMADLEGFEERYPLNSRLVKRDGQSRRRGLQRRWPVLDGAGAIVGHLRGGLAVRHRRDGRRPRRAGQVVSDRRDRDRAAYDIAWVDDQRLDVDTMNGFIEVYMDARGVKGAWEGIVYYENHEKTDDRALADARAVVRGSPADRREVSQADGAGRVGAGHRSRIGSRRFRPDHADRCEPPERSTHP